MSVTLSGTPVLETERLILRAPVAQDFDVWAPFVMSDRARFIGGGSDLTEGRAWRSFASFVGHLALRGCGMFTLVQRDTGRVIGGVGPWYPADWPEEEIGWHCWDTKAEGKGYMSEAVRRVRAHVFGDLGWKTAVSYIDSTNDRSIALAERVGCDLDEVADRPTKEGVVTLVYRHPAPGGAA